MRFTRLAMAAAVIAALMSLVLPAAASAAGDIDAISFRDAQNGYIGGGFLEGAWSKVGFISVTRDGGATWSATKVAGTRIRGVAARPGGALAVSDFYNGVLAFSDATGDVARLGTGPTASSSPSFFGVHAFSSGRIAIVGETDVPEYAQLRSTTNQGATWSVDFEGPKYVSPNSSYDDPLTHAKLSAIDEAPDGSAAWAIGYELAPTESIPNYTVPGTFPARLAFKSVDGGQTWVRQTVLTTTTHRQPMYALTAVSATTAYAFGADRQYLKTTDGGTNWVLSTLPTNSPEPVTTMMAADSRGDTVVAVGQYGLTARSTDGGATWIYKDIPGAGTLRGVRMLTDTTWLAVGSNETILRTEDGGVTWQGTTTAVAPTVWITSPVAGFSLSGAPVTITGLSADAGVGVIGVEYRIARADGMSFDGVGWTATETWLPAKQVDGWDQWSASWTPDAATIASGQLVSISARATDGAGMVKTTLPVTSPDTASVSLLDGAPYTSARMSIANVSVRDAAFMRWKVDNGAFTAWRSVATTAAVDLGSSDGTKTVAFEFSPDGSLISAQASDSIVLDSLKPVVRFTSTALYYSATYGSVKPSGTSGDALSGLASTRMAIMRNGLSWDPLARVWMPGESWIPESATGSLSAWQYLWAVDPEIRSKSLTATVVVQSEDRAGNVTRATMTIAPKPKTYLTAPTSAYLPAKAVRGRTYYAQGYAKHAPVHASGYRYAGIVQAERRERQKDGTYRWIRRSAWYAPAYGNGLYRVKVALPYTGTWRVRVYHAEDAFGLSGVSAYRTIYVR